MSENLTPEQKEEISKKEARIEALSVQRGMWSQAGGAGGRMALQANTEIAKLQEEIDSIKNGTNNSEIIRIGREIAKLKTIRSKATLLEKPKFNGQIRKLKKELNVAKRKR